MGKEEGRKKKVARKKVVILPRGRMDTPN